MRNLLEFFINYRYWFLFLLLEAVSFVLLFRFNSYQGSVYFTSANTVVGTYYAVVSEVTSFFGLKTQNGNLSAENVRLQQRICELEDRIFELSGDSVSGDVLDGKYELIDALVVNSTLHRNNNLITINKGEADGVRPEMGVVSSSGVVGVVGLVSEHYSIVIPLVNTSSNISCRLKTSEYFGTLRWQRGAINVSYVSDIPRHAKVERGEIVETNGYSDIFPAGIPVGRVLDFEDSADGMAFMMRVKLFTDFSTLRNVSVIKNYVNTERRLLESKADSLSMD